MHENERIWEGICPFRMGYSFSNGGGRKNLGGDPPSPCHVGKTLQYAVCLTTLFPFGKYFLSAVKSKYMTWNWKALFKWNLNEWEYYVVFVLVIPWQRGKFGINFPRKFTKSEISRAQRGKFDFLNLRGKLIPKFPERAWDSWLIPQLSILIIWKFKNYLTHRKQNIQESWMGWNHKTGHLFWTPNLLYMHFPSLSDDSSILLSI